ncbi:hypothetical protein O5O45_04370 [Hahella aquimaris]|uniref:hypothetical protein n=1 Tax=Hahella sp. HNIBRBA332 TaxID=3015983 RepID=UPI00273BB857|nr:hypothetical protein [Hahella sp. HNIBRBA332]WLQ15165.1 hypothetical protein O5O45_04370 [Hahella sp. HNIBRBA332]
MDPIVGNAASSSHQVNTANPAQGVVGGQSVATRQSQGGHSVGGDVASLETSHAEAPSGLKAKPSAQEIYDHFKGDYKSDDRSKPYEIMREVTKDKISFDTEKPSLNGIQKRAYQALKNMPMTLRHYSTNQQAKGQEPPFKSIASNFELVHNGVKDLSGGSSSNTNQKDWTHCGNTAFTFFLVSIDGQVSDKAKFLDNCTHYAEVDLSSDSAKSLGEIWASKDLLDERDLGSAVAIKGTPSEFKDLICLHLAKKGALGMNVDAKNAVEKLDTAVFKGLPEVKVPGAVQVAEWKAK